MEESVFGDLIDAKLPRLAAHLRAHGIFTEIYATRWFVGLYASAL